MANGRQVLDRKVGGVALGLDVGALRHGHLVVTVGIGLGGLILGLGGQAPLRLQLGL